MQQIKKSLFSELRKKMSDGGEMLSDDQMNREIFHHVDGLRLSLHGFMLVKTIFTAYSFEIPGDIKSKHRRALSKLQYPYFFTKKRLVLFSELDAMTIKLSGSISVFLESQLD